MKLVKKIIKDKNQDLIKLTREMLLAKEFHNDNINFDIIINQL